jgi:ApaG protein
VNRWRGRAPDGLFSAFATPRLSSRAFFAFVSRTKRFCPIRDIDGAERRGPVVDREALLSEVRIRGGETMYRAITRNIEVRVEPFYLEDQSSPEQGRYVWAYRVTIDNRSDEWVQLLSRYWHITDGAGRIEEVRGAGVVGEQPELNPGDSYQYTSGCPLSTPSGIMVGRYTMRNDRDEMFDIDIPAFSLDLPGTMHTVN